MYLSYHKLLRDAEKIFVNQIPNFFAESERKNLAIKYIP